VELLLEKIVCLERRLAVLSVSLSLSLSLSLSFRSVCIPIRVLSPAVTRN